MKQVENELLILSVDAERYLELIRREEFPELGKIVVPDSPGDGEEGWENCNIILGDPDLTLPRLPYMKRLGWVQSTWAGVAPFMGENLRKDYQLTGVKGVFGPLMSEYVFCYMLMHEQKASARRAATKKGVWDDTVPGSLKGKLVGIMGVGSIGSHVAATAKYFGMNTRGYTRSDASCPHIDRYFHGNSLSRFASGLDYLVCLLPHVSEMDNAIDLGVLGAMNRNALLINGGRGNAVNDGDLVAALEGGMIGGAVLDVFREEPLPGEHPFWTTPNLTVTAHTAALSRPEDIIALFRENCRNYVGGRELNCLIDFKRGY